MYSFYSKPMASSKMIQNDCAMPENMKITTLNQEVIRRMMNTSEDLGMMERNCVIDDYAMKVVNSGYGLKQTRNIVVGGLKGYERKLELSRNKANPKWRPLHQGDDYNVSGRHKKKILAKTSWFKRKRDEEDEGEGRQPSGPSIYRIW